MRYSTAQILTGIARINVSVSHRIRIQEFSEGCRVVTLTMLSSVPGLSHGARRARNMARLMHNADSFNL